MSVHPDEATHMAEARGLALTPLLAGTYFVLALAAGNGNESIQFSDLGLPLLASTGFAVLAYLLSRAYVGRDDKAAVLSTGMVIGTSIFGYLVRAMEDLWSLDRSIWAEPLLLAMIAGLLVVAPKLRRSRRRFLVTARYLRLMLGLLTAFALVQLALQRARESRSGIVRPVATASVVGDQAQSRQAPDIYLIVPDKYTGSSELEKNYGFANDSFEHALRQRGFIVPRDARANYMHTFLALGAMLNARYLDDVVEKLGRNATSRRAVDQLIEDNLLMATFRRQGYRIVFTPTAYPATRRNRLADVQIPTPDRIRPEFATAWIWTTPFPILHEEVCKLVGCALARATYPPETAELLDWKFGELGKTSGSTPPTFAFIHLNLPHEPYLYRRNCAHRAAYWPERELEAKQAYVEQIECLNKKLLNLIDTLTLRASVPPVILIQSDHGHGRVGRMLPPIDAVPSEQLAERSSVFAAFRMPGVPTGDLPSTITPINAVRLLLRRYGGLALYPVEDATYWSSSRWPYRLVRVPELATASGRDVNLRH